MLFVISIFMDTSLLYLYFFNMLKKRRFPSQTIILDLFVFLFAQIAYTALTHTIIGDISTNATLLRLLLNALLDFALTYLFLAKIWFRILTVISYLVFLSLSELLSMRIIQFFIDFSNANTTVPETVFDSVPILMNLFVLCFIFFAAAVSHRKENVSSTLYILLLSVTPLLSLLISIAPDIFKLSYTAPHTYFALIYFLVLINLVNYILMQSRVSTEQLYAQTRQQEQQLQYQQSKYEQLSNSYRNIRAFMHDIKKHMHYIEHCVYQEQYNKIIPYTQEATQDLESRYCTVNTGDLAIDTFVSSLLSQANAKELTVETNLNINPSALPLNDYDLAVILGNLIDNALQSCNEPRDKISISVQTLQDNFVIHMSNTLHAPETSHPTETDIFMHGYGLANIKNTVEKNDGFCIAESEDDMFSVSIVIPNYVPGISSYPAPRSDYLIVKQKEDYI